MQGARVPHLFPGDKDSVVDGIEENYGVCAWSDFMAFKFETLLWPHSLPFIWALSISLSPVLVQIFICSDT